MNISCNTTCGGNCITFWPLQPLSFMITPVSCVVCDLLTRLGGEVLYHLSYSPDLIQWLLPKLEEPLRGIRFQFLKLWMQSTTPSVTTTHLWLLTALWRHHNNEKRSRTMLEVKWLGTVKVNLCNAYPVLICTIVTLLNFQLLYYVWMVRGSVKFFVD